MSFSTYILSRFLIVVASGFLDLAFQLHIFRKNEHPGLLFTHAFRNTCVYIPLRWINRQVYMLYRFIFYLYVYSVDFHHCTESIFKSSFTSTSNNLAILTRLAKSGCEELVHHFETVEGLIFNCSDSHLLVLFFSTNTTFSLFISFISTTNFYINKDNEYFSLRQIEDSHIELEIIIYKYLVYSTKS